MQISPSSTPGKILATRIFTLSDQLDFARFSGDYNPIHVDETFARRTLAGRCIVHGMHGVLWALDALALAENLSANAFKIRFVRPVFLDQEVICTWDPNHCRLTITADGAVLTTIAVNVDVIRPILAKEHPVHRSGQSPLALTFEDCANLGTQSIEAVGTTNLAAVLFPSFCSNYGLGPAVDFGLASYVVGMRCPGLHSLFTKFIGKLDSSPTTAQFSVSESDARFGLINLAFRGTALTGDIETIYRPPPSINPTVATVARSVVKGEFSSTRALVLGGSRGLGELVAKLLAAGGAQIVLTYLVGEADAGAICREINENGGICQHKQLSATAETLRQVDYSEFNQIYYFPTPKILGSRSPQFDALQGASYREIYVDAFEALCNTIIKNNLYLSVFYPSSVFVEKAPPGLEAYAKSKREGELIANASHGTRGLKILSERLPQLATDQNQTLVDTAFMDSVACLLPIIRRMHSM
jgi:hypothetical protein